jgi:LDH2 family malate/lactate/ureidoglycolate dehydrogenase
MSAASSPGFSALTPSEATALAVGALVRAGATATNAACVARHLVDAELAGHPSHGLRLVPLYCEQSGSPGTRLDATPVLVETRGATSVVDAAGGLGYPALELAVDTAAESALEFGVGACSVIRCGHAGRAGAWVERASERGAAGIVLLGGADEPFVMAARPGAVASLHTNPLAVAVPGNDGPLFLDIATSLVAAGKVVVSASRGTPLPDGAIVDREGKTTSNAASFFDGGALLPFAGHKGFGLAAMVEALSVSLTGADTGQPAEGALVICLDVGAFRPEGDVRDSVEKLRNRLRRSGREDEVLAPGDPERQARASDTILVEPAVFECFARLAEPAG